MGIFRHLSASLALLLTAASAVAQAPDGEWVSYRDAYRAMVVFDKYGNPKNLIQNHFQVVARDKSVSPEGLQLKLVGRNTSVVMPLDATGRTQFPMSKVAYDEKALLVLNRKVDQYLFRPRVSIVVRPDGVYEASELRAACEQALAFQRYIDPSARTKRCTGVRFVFPKSLTDPGVKLRKGEAASLPPTDGPAFQDDPYEGFRVVNYRFDPVDKGQVVTPNAPLAIDAVFE